MGTNKATEGRNAAKAKYCQNSNTADLEERVTASMSVAGEKSSRRLVIEPRLLLDAAGVETMDTAVEEAAQAFAENWQEPNEPDHIEQEATALVAGFQTTIDTTSDDGVFVSPIGIEDRSSNEVSPPTNPKISEDGIYYSPIGVVDDGIYPKISEDGRFISPIGKEDRPSYEVSPPTNPKISEDGIYYSPIGVVDDDIYPKVSEDGRFISPIGRMGPAILSNVLEFDDRINSDDGFLTGAQQIVFIDAAVEDSTSLIAGIDPQIEIIFIDPNSDGVEQIASVLQNRSNIEAIHIISHGRPGTLDLGNAKLTEASINGKHADELAIIRGAMAEDADFLIYGCNFGAQARGASALEALAATTGADVAASDDLTGAASLGGNWDLEIEHGDIETDVAISLAAQSAFSGLLMPTVAIDSLQVDTDGDGVSDFTDIDDDNDGILDTDEGYTAPAPNLLTNNSFEELGEGATTQGPFFGGGFNNFGSNVVDWDLVAGTADVYYPSGTTTVNGSNVPAFSITDVTGGFEPGPSAGETYAAFHSGDGFPDAPGELANGREVVIHNLSSELIAGQEYILTFDVFQADGLVGSGGTGGFEVYTLDTGSVQNNATAWQDGTTVGGMVDNPGANGLNFVGLTEDISADGTPASGTAANGAAGWQTITVSFTPGTNVDRIVFTPESGLHIYYGFDNLQLFEVATATGIDSDNDGVLDHLDIDSDNDGITDNIEAQTTIGYIAPNNDSAATLAANRGLNSAYLNTNTGGGEGLAPVNSDGQDLADYLDIDSDNEGGSDAEEAGLGVVATGLSTSLNDADGDGLFDVFDTQNGTSANDGFVVNEGFANGALAYPDGDNDAAGNVPLVEDVDFRDAMTVLPNEAPTIDLDVVGSVPTPGQDGFSEFSFSAPIIENDGQSELADGVGNAETALYENVGFFDGRSVDIRAVVVENINANPTFGLSGPNSNPSDDANVNMSVNSPDGTNISTVRWEIIDSVTGNPVAANFTLLITDLDAAGNQANGFQGERISVSEDAIDAFVLNDTTDLTSMVENGILTFQPADADPGTPGQDETNAVQLVFSSTSSFEITYDRSGAANFTFDGNFTPIFTTPVTEDTNADFANVFVEGNDPINIAAQSADVDDIGEGDITLLEIEPGNIADGTSEIITFNGDNGSSVSLPLDGTDTSQQSLTIGGTDILVEFNAGSGAFEITEQNGSFIPQDDLDALIRSATYENTSSTPTEGTGSDRTLTFRATDSDGLVSNDAVSTITVIGVEPPITAEDDSFTISEDGTISSDVFADNGSGVDSSGGPFSVSAVNGETTDVDTEITLPSGALLTLNSDGTFDYNPNGAFDFLDTGETGTDSFTYTIADGEGGTDTATVTITLNGDNDAPIIDLNGPNLPGTDFADVFVEDQPGQPLANLLTFDAIVQDDEDNIARISIIPLLPIPNDDDEEFLRIDSNGIDLSIRLSDGQITANTPLVFGDTTFNVALVGGAIEFTNATGGTFESDDLEGFLRLLAYQNTDQNNTNGVRSFEFQVVDPAGVTIATSSISVDRANDAPIPELDPAGDGTLVEAGSSDTPSPILTLTPAASSVVADLTEAEVLSRLQNGETASDLGLISVRDLTAQLNITDAEQTEFGIGVIFADESQGVWQYLRTDIPGHEWTDFELDDPNNENAVPVPEGQALLFDPDTVLRFVANPGFTGGAQLEFRVWDQTVGIASNPPSLVLDDSGGVAPTDTSSLSSTAFVALLAADTDGDGIINADDVDDDNDGILDTDESGSVDIVDGGDFSDPSLFTTNNVNYNSSLEAFVVSANNGVSTITQNLPDDQLLLGTRFEFGWNNGTLEDVSPSMVLELTIDGVVYARVTTSDLNDNEVPGSPGDDGFAVIEFLNGASGTVSSPATAGSPGSIVDNGDGTFSVAETRFNSWSPATLVDVDLPSGIVTSGSDVVLTFDATTDPQLGSGGTTFTGLDDIAVLNLSVLGFAEIDSDSDGIADHLDIDSDDDGITDNIEAQTTDGYIAPTGIGAGITDVNRDGLDDVYDTRNGTLTLGDPAATANEAVIDPVDTDGLGGADFIDPDADNDGIRDADENGLGVTFVAGDADGDGLADVYETAIDGNANDGFVVNEGINDPLATGSNYLPDIDGDATGTITPLTADLDYRDQLDTDQDGIADFIDVDDDNDGILDTIEGRIDNRANFSGVNLTDASTIPAVVTAAAGGGTLAAQVNVSPPVLTTDIGGTGDGGETAVVRASSGGNVLRYEVAPAQIGDVVENTLTFTDSSLVARPQIVQISTDTGLASNISESDSFTFTAINPPPGFSFIVDSSSNAEITNNGASITIIGTTSQFVAFADFSIRTNLPIEGITVEYEMFDNVVLNSGQFIFDFLEERDTDGDGVSDHLDIDSDNDGITDNVEAQSTAGYIAPSGTEDVITDVNMDGLDDVYDNRNGSLTSASTAATEAEALIDPVNTDGTDPNGLGIAIDSTPDHLDADSDGDGIDDVAERGDGAPTSITSTTDTDLDGLLDIFEGADANDGFDVNDENLDATDTNFNLSGVSALNADGSNAVPLDTDLLFRDVNNPPVAIDDPLVTPAVNETVSGADLAGAIMGGSATVTGADGTDVTVSTVSGTPITDDSTAPLGGIGIGRDPAVATSVYDVEFSNPVNSATINMGFNNNNVDGVEEIGVTIFDTSGNDITALVMVSVDDFSTIGGLSYDAVNNTIVAAPGSFGDGTNGQLIVDAGNLEIGEIRLTHIEVPGGAGNPFGVVISEIGYGINQQGVPYETDEDTAFSIPASDGVIGNDSDLDGDTLTVTMVNGSPLTSGAPILFPSGAILSMSSDGSYTYNPNGQFESLAIGETATDSFTYEISDGNGGTDTATVTITINGVNDDPIAQDDVETTNEDTVLNESVIPDNGNGADSDPDNAAVLSVTGINGASFTPGAAITLPSGALLTMNADGSYAYDPNGQFEALTNGETATDSFIYTLSDGQGGTDTATVTLTITGVTDAPIIDLDGDDSTAPGSDFLVQYIENDPAVSIVDTDFSLTDPEDNITELVITLTNGETGDTLQFPSSLPGGITATQVPGTALLAPGTQTITFNAGPATTTADWNAVLASVLFVPQTNDVHNPVPTDRIITISASDEFNTNSNVATTTVEVVPVNDAPTLDLDDDNSSGVNSGNALATFTEDGGPVSIHSEIVITDLDDTELTTATVVLTNPLANDQLVVDGVIVFDNGVVTTPMGTAAGVDFTVSLTGGQPEIVFSGPATIADMTAALESISFNNTSEDPDTTDRVVSVVVNDGEDPSPTRTSTISVIPQNDPPEVVDPTDPGNPPADPNDVIPAQSGEDSSAVTPLDVTSFFTDPDDTTLTYSLDPSAPTWLSINPITGIVTGTPPSDASQLSNNGTQGEYDVIVIASDPDGLTAQTTAVFTIANPAPDALDDDFSAIENGADVSGNVLVADNGNGIDFDPDGDTPLTVTLVGGDVANLSTPTAGTSGGLFTITPTGAFTFTDNGDFEDLAVGETRDTTITYTIDDGEGGTDTATVMVTVTGTNDDPIVVAGNEIPDAMADDGEAITPIDVTGSFDDPDTNDTLMFSASNLPMGLMIDPMSGLISGTVDNSASQVGDDPINAPGVYEVVVTADDGNGGTATDTFIYTVANPAPMAEDDAFSGDEDTVNAAGNVLSANPTSPDTDPDGDMLMVSQVDGDAASLGMPIAGSNGGLFTIDANGDLSFDPNGDFEALAVGESTTTTITYEVSDGEGGVDTATVTYTVNGVNDDPVPFDPDDPGTPPADPNDFIPTQTGTDDQPVTPLDVSQFVIDPDTNDTLTFVIDPTELPPGLMFDGTTISGTLDPDASQGGDDPVNNPGVYEIPVTVTDGNGGTFMTTITYSIDNPPPIAIDDAVSGSEDGLTNGDVFAANPTTADSDPDGDNFMVTRVAPGNDETALAALMDGDGVGPATVAGSAGGEFTLNADGMFSFDPGTDFQDLDTGESRITEIVYQIDDGEGGTDTAVVTFTVIGANDGPVVIDPNDPFPNPNDPPVPADPDNVIPDQTGNDNTPITPLDISPFFADVDVEPLTFGFDPADPNIPSWLAINPATGEITGTPPTDASQGGPNNDGVYPITVTATDPDGEVVTTTVDFTISNIPPVAVDDVSSATEDDVQMGNVLTDPTTGDSDGGLDDDPLMVTDVDGNPVADGMPAMIALTYGDLEVNSDGSWTFTPNNLANQLSDTDPAVIETVIYTIDDGNGGTDTATLEITINGVNDPVQVVDPNDPTTDPQDPSYDPNNPTVIPDPDNLITDENYNDGDTITPIPAGDFFGDAEGDTITFSATDLPPGLMINPISGEITGMLDADASQGGNTGTPGEYLVTVTAMDPQGNLATTTVTITASNIPPAAQDDAVVHSEDGVGIGDVFADNGNGIDQDTPPDTDPISVSEVAGDPANLSMPTSGTNGGQFTINPDGTYTFDPGTDFQDLDTGENRDTTIEYTIDDGNGGTDTATITVTVEGANDGPVVIDPNDPFPNPNDPPVPADPNNVIPDISAEDAETPADLDASLFFADVDDDVATEVTFGATNLPLGLMIDPSTGVISGTIDNSASQGGDDPINSPGVYTVVITAMDPEGEMASTEVTYTITNPPPIASNDALTTDEDTIFNGDILASNPTVAGGADGQDTDPDGDDLSVSAINGDPAGVGQAVEGSNGGTFTVNADGTFEFDPGDDFNGLGVGEQATTTITYQISDGEGGFDEATGTMTVTGVNDGPIPIDPMQPPIDPDNPPMGVPFDPDDPREPPADDQNYIPEQAGQDGTSLSPIDLTPFFGDPDANDTVVLSVDPATLPDGVTFDPVTGTLSGTPSSDASQGGDPMNPGTYLIEVTATDGSGETFTTNVTLVITNPPPVVTLEIEDFQQTVGEDFSTLIADNFNDPDGDTLTYSADGLPGGLTIDPATGVISGTLDPSAVVDAPNGDGIYTVTITADDGQGGVISTTFTFTALDAFVPTDAPPEPPQGPDVPGGTPLEVGDADTVILNTIDDLQQEREELRRLAAVFANAGTDGFPDEEYRGGHETIATIAGETVIRTMVYQDRLFLEVASPQASQDWTLATAIPTQQGNWFEYQDANLFVGFADPLNTVTEVILENTTLGVTVELMIDTQTGTFEVRQLVDANLNRGLQGFTAQLQTVSDNLNAATQPFLKPQS